MSFLTGTNTELIYSSTGAGAAYNTSVTQTLLNANSTTMVQAHIPPDFWLPTNTSIGRGIRIVARGLISTTTGPPTFTFNVYLGASGATTTQILGAPAITTVASVTNVYWELQGDFILTAIGKAGTNSSGAGYGTVVSPAGFASPFTYALFGGAAQPGTIANVDTSITNYINVMGTWSASSASNSVTLEQLLVFGLN
jgi:hypothetical protein